LTVVDRVGGVRLTPRPLGGASVFPLLGFAQRSNADFADDAKVQRPNRTTMTGPKEIGDSHSRSLSRFQATQHLASGFIITLKDDTSAEFRANLVAMHLWAEGHGDPNADPNDNYFLAGGVITGHVILGASGWRITELTNQVSWRRGTGFQQMLQMR
jgi:hypothetical protein